MAICAAFCSVKENFFGKTVSTYRNIYIAIHNTLCMDFEFAFEYKTSYRGTDRLPARNNNTKLYLVCMISKDLKEFWKLLLAL